MSHNIFSDEELVEAMSAMSSPSFEAFDSPSPAFPVTTPLRPVSPIAQPVQDIDPCSNSETTVQHSKYYFSDPVTVQVGDFLYCIPRWIFQQSPTFTRQTLDNEATKPILVDDITTEEMNAFLDVCDARLVVGVSHFTCEQWMRALVVADRLEIPTIKNYLIERVDEGTNQLNPFDCIDMALKYRKREWLINPFLRICKQSQPLSLQEVVRLGSERATAIARVRESLFAYEAQQQMAWVRSNWPTHASRRSLEAFASSRRLAVAQPDWSRMSTTVKAAVSTELERLVNIEAVFSEAESLPSSNNNPTTYSTATTGKLHPRHFELELETFKLRNTLYRLPTQYLDLSGLLQAAYGRNTPSVINSLEAIVLPEDLEVSEWDTFLDILTARPFEEPLLSFPFSSWMTGLRVAARFHQPIICDYIVKRLQADFPDHEPADLLEAAKIAKALPSPWLQNNYDQLARRNTAPSADEILRVGEVAMEEVCKRRWSLQST